MIVNGKNIIFDSCDFFTSKSVKENIKNNPPPKKKNKQTMICR